MNEKPSTSNPSPDQVTDITHKDADKTLSADSDTDAQDWDELSFLDEMELGNIEPDSYQEQTDDGCEGGACKI